MRKNLVLILDALEFMLTHDSSLWTGRRQYLLEVLIELYEEYLENLPKDAVCREMIVKESQNNLKRFRKMYKELEHEYERS